MGKQRIDRTEIQLHPPGEQVGDHRRSRLVRHMDDVHAGERLEEFRAEMLRAARTGGSEIDAAGFGLSHRDQFADVVRRDRGMHHHHEGDVGDGGDRRKVLERIARVLQHVRIHHQHVVGREQPGMAVGRALGHRLGADAVAGPRAVLHHHRRAPVLLHLLRNLARRHIEAGAGAAGHDDAHGTHRKRLRERAGRRQHRRKQKRNQQDGETDSHRYVLEGVRKV